MVGVLIRNSGSCLLDDWNEAKHSSPRSVTLETIPLLHALSYRRGIAMHVLFCLSSHNLWKIINVSVAGTHFENSFQLDPSNGFLCKPASTWHSNGCIPTLRGHCHPFGTIHFQGVAGLDTPKLKQEWTGFIMVKMSRSQQSSWKQIMFTSFGTIPYIFVGPT